jgi:hypothetical protein
VVETNPGSVSTSAGTLGSSGDRVALPTARGFSLPASISGIASMRLANVRSRLPPSMSFMICGGFL